MSALATEAIGRSITETFTEPTVGRTTVRPLRPRRPAGQPPTARPAAFSTAGRSRAPIGGGRGCVGEAAVIRPATIGSAGWRLTDRGVAMVVVTMVVILTAAVTVIGLTAFRVTGDSYVGAGHSQLSAR